MVNGSEKVIKRSCQISKVLHDEIRFVMDNLRNNEKKKTSGFKKKKVNFLTASDELGYYLKNQRKNIGKQDLGYFGDEI